MAQVEEEVKRFSYYRPLNAVLLRSQCRDSCWVNESARSEDI